MLCAMQQTQGYKKNSRLVLPPCNAPATTDPSPLTTEKYCESESVAAGQ